jgi:hypothetical protein
MLLLKNSPLIVLDLCVGGAILGLPIAVAGYYLAFNAITLYRERLRERVHIPLRRKNRRPKAAANGTLGPPSPKKSKRRRSK